MPKKVPYKTFYAATGEANASWQAVEDRLCDIFSRTVICSISGTMRETFHPNATWMVHEVFYGSTNIRARLNMITSMLERVVEDENIKTEWTSIKNKTLKLYKRRNIIAHGHVWGNEEGASSVAQSIFSGPTSKKYMSYVEVIAITKAFEQHAERCEKLAIAINEFFSDHLKRRSQNIPH